MIAASEVRSHLVMAARSGQGGLQMRRRDRARLILRFSLSTVSYLAIIAAGLLLIFTLYSAFATVLVVAIVVLLVVSLRNT